MFILGSPSASASCQVPGTAPGQGAVRRAGMKCPPPTTRTAEGSFRVPAPLQPHSSLRRHCRKAKPASNWRNGGPRRGVDCPGPHGWPGVSRLTPPRIQRTVSQGAAPQPRGRATHGEIWSHRSFTCGRSLFAAQTSHLED